MKHVSVVLVSLFLQAGGDEACEPGERFSTCDNGCLPTCRTPDSTNCNFFACETGCVCEDSLIRQHATGKCIPREFCPVFCDDENAVETSCVPKCPQTCQHTYSEPCSEECEPGCVCKDGFIKDEISGKCVLIESCPKCGTNEEYNICGPTCSKSCVSKDYKVWLGCVDGCKPGCLCKEGYVKEEVSNECVLPEACPACNKNETYAGHGMDCQNCSNYKFVKCALKTERKCYCSNAYVRDETTGRCVYYHDCPQYPN